MALNPADIVAGKPTKEEIFQTIDTVLDEHEARLDLLDQSSKFDMIDVVFQGSIGDYIVTDVNSRCPIYKAPGDGNIVSVVITLLEASSSGTLSMDIQRSTDDGANWNSILSGGADVTGITIGSISPTPSFILGGQTVAQNDLFRIQFLSLQSGQGDFHVSIYGERS